MHAITINNLSDEAFERIAALAAQHRKSLEEEAADLLQKALDTPLTPKERYVLAKKIAAMTPKDVTQTDSVELLREDRSR